MRDLAKTLAPLILGPILVLVLGIYVVLPVGSRIWRPPAHTPAWCYSHPGNC